jgi:hypothetical protein
MLFVNIKNGVFMTYTKEQVSDFEKKGWIWRSSGRFKDTGLWIRTENRECKKHGLTSHSVVMVETNRQRDISNIRNGKIEKSDIDSVCKLCCDNNRRNRF